MTVSQIVAIRRALSVSQVTAERLAASAASAQLRTYYQRQLTHIDAAWRIIDAEQPQDGSKMDVLSAPVTAADKQLTPEESEVAR